MAKVLCFIYDKMADFELIFSCHVLGTCGGQEIVPMAYENKQIISGASLIYYPKCTVKEALNLDDVAGIIIPGGWNDEQRPELTELIQKLDGENKFIASICAGPQYLARAGILKGKKYTTTMTAKVYEERGTVDPFPRDTYVKQNVVRDGNIITAVGAAFIDFAVEIADYMKLFENPEEKESFTKAYKCI